MTKRVLCSLLIDKLLNDDEQSVTCCVVPLNVFVQNEKVRRQGNNGQ